MACDRGCIRFAKRIIIVTRKRTLLDGVVPYEPLIMQFLYQTWVPIEIRVNSKLFNNVCSLFPGTVRLLVKLRAATYSLAAP